MSGLLCLIQSHAQKQIQEVFTWEDGQKISIDFDYPELIKVQVWDKNEILVKGSVNINFGENDDAFKLSASKTKAGLSINGAIENYKQLPKAITLVHKGEKFVFKSSSYNAPEIQKFKEENGIKSVEMYSQGVHNEILLEVFVPRNADLNIASTYGTIEIFSHPGPLTATSKYGAVDISIMANSKNNILASTRYGEIYTNLDVKFNPSSKEGLIKWTDVSCTINGGGKALQLSSTYGNLYMRKER